MAPVGRTPMRHRGNTPTRRIGRRIMLAAALFTLATPAAAQTVDTYGTIHVPAIAIPESTLLSAETRRHLAEQRNPAPEQSAPPACPDRKSGVQGKRGSVRVDFGGRRSHTKK